MALEPPLAPTVPQIIAAVAAHTGHTSTALTGKTRHAPVVRARHLAMWLARQLRPEMSLPTIGRAFKRDHTTVLLGIRRYEERNGQRDPTAVWLDVITSKPGEPSHV